MADYKEDRIFSPADLSSWFDVPRTTLFRWEDTNKVSPADRGPRGQRLYTKEHVKQVAEAVINQMTEEALLRTYPDGPGLPDEVYERLHKVRFFSGDDPVHALKQLLILARRPGKRLSRETLDLVIESTLQRPRGDPVREELWRLLQKYEQAAT